MLKDDKALNMSVKPCYVYGIKSMPCGVEIVQDYNVIGGIVLRDKAIFLMCLKDCVRTIMIIAREIKQIFFPMWLSS